MWIIPKTNWKSTDSFTINPDYYRICSNMKYLHDMARKLYPEFELLHMGDYTINGLPYVEFFSNIEENLAKTYSNTFARTKYSCRDMQENGTVWDFRDLNRIEGILEQVYSDLLTQQKLRPTLDFMLGGGGFATFI